MPLPRFEAWSEEIEARRHVRSQRALRQPQEEQQAQQQRLTSSVQECYFWAAKTWAQFVEARLRWDSSESVDLWYLWLVCQARREKDSNAKTFHTWQRKAWDMPSCFLERQSLWLTQSDIVLTQDVQQHEWPPILRQISRDWEKTSQASETEYLQPEVSYVRRERF